MINSNGWYRIHGTLWAWDIKNTILPVPRLGLPISKSVHSKSLPSSFMPRSLVSMTICKSIHPKTMHLVRKIFSRICIPIPSKLYKPWLIFFIVKYYRNWLHLFTEKNCSANCHRLILWLNSATLCSSIQLKTSNQALNPINNLISLLKK